MNVPSLDLEAQSKQGICQKANVQRRRSLAIPVYPELTAPASTLLG
jgi:hypothetical protein